MLTRRQVLLGGAATGLAAGLGGLGCSRGGGADRFDVCVIGSGFAGVYLALRTAEAGLATAVIEAGGPAGDGDGLAPLFECDNSGRLEYPVSRSRVIAIGGTSNHWTGSLNRLRPSDFRVRSEFGLYSDWPLDYDTLEPYYCQAERALWATGGPPVPGAEPQRHCAYPFELPSAAPYRMPQVSHRGEPVAFFPVARSRQNGRGGVVRLQRAEIPRLAATPGVSLLTGHMASELVSEDGRSIDHLVVRDADGGEERIHARHFVVAAGVLESARLLLRSRSSAFPDGLGNAEDLVGRYFVAHPTFMWTVPVDAPASLPPGVHRTYHLNDRLRARGLNACHFQLHVERPGRVVWKAQPEIEPRRANRLTLSPTRRDRLGAPLPDLRFAPSRRDLSSVRAALPFLREQLRALGVDRRPIERTRRWRYHPAGTCRMAADERGGVVDRDGRVFGTENLYVSGAAVFPNSGTANPTLTVVALTLRLADHLIERG